MRRVPTLLLSCLLLGTSAASAASKGEAAPSIPAARDSVTLDSLPDEDGVAELLWERSTQFTQARIRVDEAQAELTRTQLLPNPELDLSWNTLPLGPTNPPGLDRLRDVPNYQAGVSQLVELGKRGPRQRSARAALSATALDVQAELRELTYDFLQRVAAVATAQVRLAELEGLAADAARLTGLERIRQQRGDTAGLDVDRAVLEEAQLQGQLAEEHSNLSEALLECSRAAGLACVPFSARELAAAFLERRLSRTPTPNTEELPQRPDLRALQAQRQSSQESLTLARRGWVPDPTFRVGYVHDRFVESGNQLNSVFVGMSFPLPVFDRGQASARLASAQAEAAERTRQQLTAQARRDVTALVAQRDALEARRAQVRQKNLPLASSLVGRLEAAVKAGGASLQDLIFARRTYGQLLLDAAQLDLNAYHLSVELERASAAGPRAPGELGSHF
ncbi:TolC family protein [Melittangium boletus]|uniref:TolC family protein n=1 Tax=Melittangium boletus TaxID=83453 RepID=UPI003DA271E4